MTRHTPQREGGFSAAAGPCLQSCTESSSAVIIVWSMCQKANCVHSACIGYISPSPKTLGPETKFTVPARAMTTFRLGLVLL